MMLGSVSQQLLHHSHSPVAVVRESVHSLHTVEAGSGDLVDRP